MAAVARGTTHGVGAGAVMDSTTAALRAINVVKRYGEGATAVLAVNEVSFTIERGEFVALVGPSGSGKTSMLAMLAGLLNPTEGRLRSLANR